MWGVTAKLPPTLSIAVITRNLFFEIGIDNQQTGIIHFVPACRQAGCLLRQCNLLKNSNVFADES